MSPGTPATPAEFGAALRAVRERSGVALETIAGRTKISPRVLSALETGDFRKLPDRVFGRMFLRQYLEAVGAAPEEWVAAFESAWEKHEGGSHPRLALPPVPIRRRHFGHWVVGVALVSAGAVGVWLLAEAPGPHAAARVPDAAGAVTAVPPRAPAETPAPTPVPTAAAATPETPGDVLVVRTAAIPCWVEVRIAGERPTSRLLAAGASWEVPAGGREVDLVLGNAGAATVEYLGEVRRPAGPSGAVARIHLDGSVHGSTAR